MRGTRIDDDGNPSQAILVGLVLSVVICGFFLFLYEIAVVFIEYWKLHQ